MKSASTFARSPTPRAGQTARSADRFEEFYAYEVNVARFLLPLYARLNRGHTGRNQG